VKRNRDDSGVRREARSGAWNIIGRKNSLAGPERAAEIDDAPTRQTVAPLDETCSNDSRIAVLAQSNAARCAARLCTFDRKGRLSWACPPSPRATARETLSDRRRASAGHAQNDSAH
jgi:hypothetical protein